MSGAGQMGSKLGLCVCGQRRVGRGHKDGVEWGAVGWGGGGSFCSYAFSFPPLGLVIYGGVLFKMHRRKIADVNLRFN